MDRNNNIIFTDKNVDKIYDYYNEFLNYALSYRDNIRCIEKAAKSLNFNIDINPLNGLVEEMDQSSYRFLKELIRIIKIDESNENLNTNINEA